MSTTPRTPCSLCGYLHRYSGKLPKGKTAKCKNCGIMFIIQESLDTPDDIRFLVFHSGKNLGAPTKCVGENHHRKELWQLLSRMEYNEQDPPALIPAVFCLIPETDNQHDVNAVRVELEGVRLAYLSRKDAKSHREGLIELGKPLFRFNASGRITILWNGLPGDEEDNEEGDENDKEGDLLDDGESTEDPKITLSTFRIELDISWTES